MDVEIIPRTGLRLKNPVMTASGTFGYGTEFAAHNDISQLGGIVSKGTTREPLSGNAPLRVLETPASMLNAIGLQNIGVEAVIREKAPVWATWQTPVFVNISGTSTEDYQYIAARLDGTPGVSGIEVNVSCPNVKSGGVAFGIDAKMTGEVTRAVRDATSLPVVVKLSPNVTDIRPIALAAQEAGADALTLVNTLYGMAIDVRDRRPELGNGTGGLSGPAIRPYAVYLVYQTAQVIDIPIIGAGGVTSASAALEFLMAGATAVQVGSMLMVDPYAGVKIARGIRKWCRREGVKDLREVIGAANPAASRKPAEAYSAGFEFGGDGGESNAPSKELVTNTSTSVVDALISPGRPPSTKS